MNLEAQEFRWHLRASARLLMLMPLLGAVACFFHFHGYIGTSLLTLILVLAFAAGASGAHMLILLARVPTRLLATPAPSAASTAFAAESPSPGLTMAVARHTH